MAFQFKIYDPIKDDSKEFKNITNDESEIFKQVVVKEIFAVDKYGDLIIKDNEPIIIGENKGSVFKLSSNNKFYNQLNGKSNLIESSAYDGYLDVYQLDESLPEDGGKLLICYKDNIYQGSVWIFENNDYIAMYGIRSSLYNYFNKIKGTATIILNEIIRLAKDRSILVPWPLEGMIPLLKKYKFIEYNIKNKNSQRKFLSKFVNTTGYWELVPKNEVNDIIRNFCKSNGSINDLKKLPINVQNLFINYANKAIYDPKIKRKN